MELSKKRILVIFFSQTGQLKDLIDKTLVPLKAFADIDFAFIEPHKPFPWPWTSDQFFDVMPECVLQKPIEVQLKGYHPEVDYDLIIFGYQPWFLHPSLPANSFFQLPESRILKGKPIITIIGARNMWLNAQERIKEQIIQKGGLLVGNIVYLDSSPNLVSLLTVIRWSFKGQKEASRFLPAAGVQEPEIMRASIYGDIILQCIETDDYSQLQSLLVLARAVELKPGLILLERTGLPRFRKWSSFIRQKGGPQSKERIFRLRLFKNILIVGIFVLSPIKALISYFQVKLSQSRLKKDIKYFQSVDFQKNMI